MGEFHVNPLQFARRRALPLLLGLAPMLHGQQFQADLLQPLENILFAGDLDGDGLADLVVAVSGQPGTQVLTNLGDGRFLRQPPRPCAVMPLQPWAAGDIDGDGDLDLLSFSSQGAAMLLRNDHTAMVDVGATNWIAPNMGNPGELRFVDIDGDGDLDVIGVSTYFPINVFANDGHGVFTAVLPSNQPRMPGIFDALVRDLDGDGADDLLLKTYTGPMLYMLRRGTFVDETSARLPVVPGSTLAMAPFDSDGDGDLDLAMVTNAPAGQPALRLLQNQGNGVFVDVTAQQLPTITGYLESVLPIDFDADGYPDLLFGVPNQPHLLLHNLRGAGFALVPAGWQGDLVPGDAPRAVIDLDRDGYPDLQTDTGLLRNMGGQRLRWLASKLRIDVVALVDVDGDGDRDALAGDGIWRNEGGSFRRDGSLPIGWVTATGDFDGDGDVDMLTDATGRVEVRLNDGLGNFTTIGVMPVLAMLNGLALGDVDGDGDLDLATASGIGVAAAQNRLFLNDGAGHFTDATATSLPAWLGGCSSVSFGDADGDGDLDLVFSVNSGTSGIPHPSLLLYLNQLNGVFADHSQLVPSTVTTTFLGGVTQFAQLDADPELEMVHAWSGTLRIFDRVGTSWQDVSASWLPASANPATRVVPVDVDEDGDVDLVVKHYGVANRLLANDGHGAFTDVTAARGGGLADIGPAADLDGDGDIDLLTPFGLLRNMQRQLRLPLPPRTGATSTLEYVAEPGFGTATHLALVGLSLHRQAHPATTPVGTFFLGSGVIYAGMLSNQGSAATASLAVPASAALSGLALYLQGIDLTLPSGAVHLTNLIAARIE